VSGNGVEQSKQRLLTPQCHRPAVHRFKTRDLGG
jgi:hypothetical protein